jgi:hypothetical protein
VRNGASATVLDMNASADPTVCIRCGGTRHLVTDDGPTRCRLCIMVWGHYAASVMSSTGPHERGRAELEHQDHSVPRPGCLLCAAMGSPWPRRGT